jgi:hypothetical protein
VRREVVRDDLLDWLDSSSSGSGSTPKSVQDIDPVLVLLSNKDENEKKKDTSEDKIVSTKDKVAYEIQKEVDGLEKDIKENDRLLEWIAAETVPEKQSDNKPGYSIAYLRKYGFDHYRHVCRKIRHLESQTTIKLAEQL